MEVGRTKSEVKKKSIGITPVIIIMACLLSGCGEHVEENQPEEIQPSDIKIDQEDGLVPESDPGEDEEPTEEAAADETNDAVPVLLVRAVCHDSDGNISEYSESLYDTFGNQIKLTWFDTDGSLSSWKEWKYDVSGNKISEIYCSDGYIYDWYECQYDESGNEIMWISYTSDRNIRYRSEWEYDAAGNRIKENDYNSNNELFRWYEYEYDESGNRVKENAYNSEGNIYWWKEYEYDACGNLIRTTSYNPDGSIWMRGEYEYDASGNQTKEIWYVDDNLIYVVEEWEYDASGNCIKYTSYEPVPEINEWWEYEYDSSANCTKEIRYNPDGSIKRWYEYEYIGLSYKASEQLPEEITKQIEIYVNQREAWLPEPERFMPTYYYTWNDLNLDGSLELICSYYEGTGWYSRSYVYAINSAGEVECVADICGEDAPDLLWGLELYADVPKEGQAPEHFYIRTEDLLHDNRDLERADTVITFTAELTEWQRERFRSCLEEYTDGTHSKLVEATYWGSGWETISREEWEHLEEEFLKDKELITADFVWDRLWTYTYEELAENALTDKELGEALEALYVSWQELEP